MYGEPRAEGRSASPAGKSLTPPPQNTEVSLQIPLTRPHRPTTSTTQTATLVLHIIPAGDATQHCRCWRRERRVFPGRRDPGHTNARRGSRPKSTLLSRAALWPTLLPLSLSGQRRSPSCSLGDTGNDSHAAGRPWRLPAGRRHHLCCVILAHATSSRRPLRSPRLKRSRGSFRAAPDSPPRRSPSAGCPSVGMTLEWRVNTPRSACPDVGHSSPARTRTAKYPHRESSLLIHSSSLPSPALPRNNSAREIPARQPDWSLCYNLAKARASLPACLAVRLSLHAAPDPWEAGTIPRPAVALLPGTVPPPDLRVRFPTAEERLYFRNLYQYFPAYEGRENARMLISVAITLSAGAPRDALPRLHRVFGDALHTTPPSGDNCLLSVLSAGLVFFG
ncbi:hypothetical protein C7M84_022156 [Penaeus vannamei]|uniref:Uncharacterized protein n=1 Tax=Penaeus vannamei TaxID=6689 RepID=A0A423U7G5_PENVA|nr:hypothetical protein C7M84_022156 [Penaeus vannamei]